MLCICERDGVRAWMCTCLRVYASVYVCVCMYVCPRLEGSNDWVCVYEYVCDGAFMAETGRAQATKCAPTSPCVCVCVRERGRGVCV